MQTITQMALEESQAAQKLTSRLEQLLKKCPEGRVEMTMSKGRPKYYLINHGSRKYLGRNKAVLIQSMVEKSYYKQLLRESRKAQLTLKHFLDDYDPDAQIRVYEKMHTIRKSLVTPLIKPYDQFAEEWLEKHRAMEAANPNTFPKSGDFVTDNGEMVRSKSEILIANLLKKMGLYYVYECPLEVPGACIYPDFTILNPITRETWYWEHRGMMDKEDYVDDNMRKARHYADIGVFPGHRLVISEESLSYPLRIRDVEALIRLFFFC